MKEHGTGTRDQNGALGEMKQKESDPVPDTPVDGDLVEDAVRSYTEYLVSRGKSRNTLEKYARDIRTFLRFSQGRPLDQDGLEQYRDYLKDHYKPASVNSMLVALNQYLIYLKKGELCLKLLHLEQDAERSRERKLTREDYLCLVKQAGQNGNRRLFCMLQTLGSTGIRIGELPFITVECLDQKTASVTFNGRTREILLPESLVKLLKRYCREMGLESGPVFVTRGGRPMDRRNVWKEMKQLCREAGVDTEKVFPHNFRHMFADSYYAREMDIVRLADCLGSSGGDSGPHPSMTGQVVKYRERLEVRLEEGIKN